MNYVLVDVLQAVVTHASDQEPRANVWILLNLQWILPLCATIDVQSREVTRELATILGNKTPLWELFLFWAFDVQPTDLVATKLEPEHIVRQVEEQMILF